MGSGYITVPGDGRIFIAPSLVLHYIDAHGYRPPDPFVAALAACPHPRSRDYGRALRDAGGPWLDRDDHGLPLGSWRSWAMQRVPVDTLVQTRAGRRILRVIDACFNAWGADHDVA